MSSAVRTDSLVDHAVCMAAGLRDGLRTAQFYVRDMSGADNAGLATPTALSRMVGGLARFADGLLSRAADLSIRLFLPQWRNLPSPFAPHMVEEVTKAIGENRLAMTSLFTAYFFRAARHILERCAEPPFLVLEHRVDAARRHLAERPTPTAADRVTVLGGVLLALVECRAIARTGKARGNFAYLDGSDPNLTVMATACLALLLAEDGKPIETLDEDEFFTIAGALLAPRLPAMALAVKSRDAKALAAELEKVRSLY